jgi:integrase/recombinase XerD
MILKIMVDKLKHHFKKLVNLRMHTVSLKPLYHRGGEHIAVNFKNNSLLNGTIRQLPLAKWSQTNKCWYVPLSKPSYQQICNVFKEKAIVDSAALKAYLEKRKKVEATIPAQQTKAYSRPIAATAAWKLSDENLAALARFTEQLKLKAYSASTIRTYRNEFLQLLQVLKKKHVNDLTTDDLRRYMVHAMEKQGIKENTAHSRLNALKFYFEQVLRREKFFWEIPRPKKQLQLPQFFNQDEIAAIIKVSGNIKHKTMLMLAYSSGLRVSEVVNLKSKNIDSKRMCILIRQAKGKKDRIVTLSPVLLVMLREYWKKQKPLKEGFLFPGQTADKPYSTRSLQLVLAAAKKRAGILKPGSIHALRHSFATHLLDKGTDVTMIMRLLGHNDIKTTLRYLHVTNRDMLQIMSPLDDLNLD